MKTITLLALATSFFVSTLSYAGVPKVEAGYCTNNQVVSSWNQMIDNAQDLNEIQKVETVNHFFNTHIRYSQDSENWNQNNFWATPFESMIKGNGDCEDYATAKFKSLLILGIPEDSLKLHYVKLSYGRSDIQDPHMILVYEYNQNESFVLDNFDARVLPYNDLEGQNFVTLFSFNTQSLWVNNQVTDQSPVRRISQWRNLLSRYNEQSPLCSMS